MATTGNAIEEGGGKAIGCGELLPEIDAPSCQRGDWAGLVVRRSRWPQKKISDAALTEGWTVLNSPLGAFTIGGVARDSKTQLRDSEVQWPKSATICYYGATSFELHYRIENSQQPIGERCARFGLDLLNVHWTAAYSPADYKDAPINIAADRVRVAEAFGELDASAFEDFNRNRDKRVPYNAPLRDGIVGTSLLAALPASGSMPSCAPLIAAGVPEDLGYRSPSVLLDYEMKSGRGRRLYSEASPGGGSLVNWYADTDGGRNTTELTEQYEENPTVRTRLFGVGCDLHFFVNRDGVVLDPKTGEPEFVLHPATLAPARGMGGRLPLMYYNVRFVAEFRLRSFVAQASGEYCVSDPFVVRVNYQPPMSHSPVLTWPGPREDPELEIIGERKKWFAKRGSSADTLTTLGSKAFDAPPAFEEFYRPNPKLDLPPCPVWELPTFGVLQEAVDTIRDYADRVRDSIDTDGKAYRELIVHLMERPMRRSGVGRREALPLEVLSPYKADSGESLMVTDLEILTFWQAWAIVESDRIAVDLRKLEGFFSRERGQQSDSDHVSAALTREMRARLRGVGLPTRGLDAVRSLTRVYDAAIRLRAWDYPFGDTYYVYRRVWKESASIIRLAQRAMRKLVIVGQHPGALSGYDDLATPRSLWSIRLGLGSVARRLAGDAALLDDLSLIEDVEGMFGQVAMEVTDEMRWMRRELATSANKFFRGVSRGAFKIAEFLAWIKTLGAVGGLIGRGLGAARTGVAARIWTGTTQSGGVLMAVSVSEGAVVSAEVLTALGRVAGAAVAAANSPEVFSKGRDGDSERKAGDNQLGGKTDTRHPPNQGFVDVPKKATLKLGKVVDRVGDEGGTYASPAGTPLGARSLPPSRMRDPLRTYEVMKPIKGVLEGRARPWFGQPGLGTQYKLPDTVKNLVKNGFLREVK